MICILCELSIENRLWTNWNAIKPCRQCWTIGVISQRQSSLAQSLHSRALYLISRLIKFLGMRLCFRFINVHSMNIQYMGCGSSELCSYISPDWNLREASKPAFVHIRYYLSSMLYSVKIKVAYATTGTKSAKKPLVYLLPLVSSGRVSFET